MEEVRKGPAEGPRAFGLYPQKPPRPSQAILGALEGIPKGAVYVPRMNPAAG